MYCPCCILLFLLISITPATCLAWPAKVISISDGDTITVLHSGVEERIRLYGIDCPEKTQDYGQQAKSITSSLITGRQVDVQIVTADQYGRTVALVLVGGQSLNGIMESLKNFSWLRRLG